MFSRNNIQFYDHEISWVSFVFRNFLTFRCKNPLTQNTSVFSSLMTSTNSCFFTIKKLAHVTNFPNGLCISCHHSEFVSVPFRRMVLEWHVYVDIWGFGEPYFSYAVAVPYSVYFLPSNVTNFLIYSYVRNSSYGCSDFCWDLYLVYLNMLLHIHL